MKHRNGSFTSAPIGRTMISTAISMLPGTLAISGYNIADTYFVGQLHNTVALAAMGYTFPVIMIIGCIFRGLATGIMATAAQALGGAKHGKAAKLITSGLCLTLVLSIICGLLGAHYIDWTFHQFGAQDNVMPYIRSYMVIWYWGVCTAALTMSCNDILMAAGSTKIASGMMVAGMLINVILDPIFIFGFAGIPAMGIAGAAWATVLSQAFAATVMLLILHFRYRFLTFVALQWRFLKNTWLMITRFAIPSMFGMLLMPIGNGVVTWVLSQFGDEAVAASAAAGRLEVVAFFFPMALGTALMPMVGQNYGARLYSRINQCRRFAMRFAFYYLLGMAFLFVVSAPWMVKFFSTDPKVIPIMVAYLRIISFGFGMIEIHRYSTFFFTGCGRPGISAWLNALRIAGLMIPFTLLALWFRSLNGVFAARLAADLIAGSIGLYCARRMTMSLPEDGLPDRALLKSISETMLEAEAEDEAAEA